ncbi:MAG: tetratricopeptide repeat protein [Planctomycetaceae bacterium]
MTDAPADAATERPLADSPVLQGERVAFTGTLASMTHQRGFAYVAEFGGTAAQHVSRQTTMLVVGEEGWPLEPDGRPSQKLCQVLQLQQQGHPCRIVREAEWLQLIGAQQPRDDVRREFTPAMVSRLLEVPVNRIRRWHRNGLLQAARTVGRLPLFEYQEVAGVRRIVELMREGVGEDRLRQGVAAVRAMLPQTTGSLAGLPVVAQDRRLLLRDEHGLIDPNDRQRCFDFTEDPIVGDTSAGDAPADDTLPETADRANDERPAIESSPRNAEDWFRRGCRLLEADDPAAAVEAFRLVLMQRPCDAETNFHLAEALYRLGDKRGTLERYYAAVEADHDYLEAWTQLGCLLAEMNETDSALDAFAAALRIHPDNPDAHWHTADVLHRLGRVEEAAPHWRAYLHRDAHGPWAETARQRLQERDA